jgi:hypothetical protein
MLKKLLLLTSLVSAQCFAAVPSQFMAKQYSEALGRAPDTGGWQGGTGYAMTNGCSASTLQALAINVFQSAEYTAKRYTPEETVLTLYRAIFSREPDDSGFNFYVNYLKSGHTAAEAVPSMINSGEFASLVPAICAGNAYNPIGSPKRPLDIGAGTWTQAQLESCINSNVVCSLPPRTVVYLTSTLTIPAGKVLETSGRPDRTLYARQARIVRDSATQGILILMQSGSTLRNVWVNGGRDRFKSSLRDNGNAQANVFPNINYIGGNYGVIDSVRSDAPLSATHIATFPVPTPSIPTSPTAFNGFVAITNNLTTGYTHSHYNDSTPIPWADGISNHIMSAIISKNDIIDPTDVGIVIFGHDGATQGSTASNNIIVHAGHSAYGSLGLDAIQCVYSMPGACRFTGTGYTNNTIFAGRNQHVDILLFNGTGPWTGANCTTSREGRCGSGGQISNNNTIMGDANQTIQVQVGLTVDGMLNTTTGGNTLNVAPMTQPADRPNGVNIRLACAKGSQMVANAISAGHASGSMQPGVDADSDACIGH